MLKSWKSCWRRSWWQNVECSEQICYFDDIDIEIVHNKHCVGLQINGNRHQKYPAFLKIETQRRRRNAFCQIAIFCFHSDGFVYCKFIRRRGLLSRFYSTFRILSAIVAISSQNTVITRCSYWFPPLFAFHKFIPLCVLCVRAHCIIMCDAIIVRRWSWNLLLRLPCKLAL